MNVRREASLQSEAARRSELQPAAQPADDGEPRLGRRLLRDSLLLWRRLRPRAAVLVPGGRAGSGADVRRADIDAGRRRAVRTRHPPRTRATSQLIRDTVPLVAAVSAEVHVAAPTWSAAIASRTCRCARVEAALRQGAQHDDRAPAAGFRPRTISPSSAWRCWAPRPRTSCSAKSRRRAKPSRSTGCSSRSSALLKTKTQISNYNTPDNECVFIPLSTASLLRDIKYPSDIVWMPANPMFREAGRQGRAGSCWRGCTTSRPPTNARCR